MDEREVLNNEMREINSIVGLAKADETIKLMLLQAVVEEFNSELSQHYMEELQN